MGRSLLWRQQLLGSLQGQLQLATYLAVFVGFTGASIVGLWIGQRNLINSTRRDLNQSAEAIETCLLEAGDQPQLLRQELLLHSNLRRQLWVEQANGTLLLPQSDHLPIKEDTIRLAMTANPERVVGQLQRLELEGRTYLSELVERFPSGTMLWVSQEVSENQRALSNYLNLMILIWGSCLVITLLTVSWLVRRIVQPLAALSAASDAVTADTLDSAQLALQEGPIEVMQLGRNYNALLQRLSDAFTQQRQFVSAVSHELRTPLTIVQGYVQRTIRRGDNLTEGQVKGLRTAEEESIRMRRLLDDLLDLSRSDFGHLEIRTVPVDLTDQLEQVADLARSTLQRPLELRLPEELEQRSVQVQADPARLRQVLLDLIENADKYSSPERPVRLELHSSGSGARIAVIDQGIGIPEEEQDLVFERFKRGSNAAKKTGSGLGLSVVKLLVEGMGGRIELQSRLGEGSCFTVELPRGLPTCWSAPC